MSTLRSAVVHDIDFSETRAAVAVRPDPRRTLVPIGRFLFSLIFIMAGFSHFSAGSIAYAASQGVPMASILVPLSGIIAFLGGLSLLLGYRARIGAGLIILFLVPVTFMMHAFWNVPDPTAAQIQMAMFMKNLAMLGAALTLAYHGAGPMSLDEARHFRRQRSPGAPVSPGTTQA